MFAFFNYRLFAILGLALCVELLFCNQIDQFLDLMGKFTSDTMAQFTVWVEDLTRSELVMVCVVLSVLCVLSCLVTALLLFFLTSNGPGGTESTLKVQKSKCAACEDPDATRRALIHAVILEVVIPELIPEVVRSVSKSLGEEFSNLNNLVTRFEKIRKDFDEEKKRHQLDRHADMFEDLNKYIQSTEGKWDILRILHKSMCEQQPGSCQMCSSFARHSNGMGPPNHN